jgi:IPT/TIG domain
MGQLFAARTDSVSGQVDILYSDDGVTFTLPPALDDVYIANDQSFGVGPRNQVYWGNNQDALKPGAIYTWDGSAVVELVGAPTDCYSSNYIAHSRDDDRLYVGFVHDVTPNVGYWDDAAQTWTLLGDSAHLHNAGNIYSGMVALTRDPGTGATIDLFTLGADGFDSAILRWNGASWDIDITIEVASVFGFVVSADHLPSQLYAHDDELYLCFNNKTAGGTPNKTIFKRDAAGAWTNISPPDAGVQYGTFRAPAMHEGNLYACYNNAAFTKIEIWKRVGTTWSMDFDSIADNPSSAFAWFESMLSFNGELYAAPEYNAGNDNYILVKTGSTWAHRTLTDSAFNFAEVATGIVVTQVIPNNGPIAGGNQVEIVGKNFEAGAEALFEHTFAGDVVVVSPTSILCTVPEHAAVVFVDVTVTNPGGDYDVGANLYEYTDDAALAIEWMGSGCVAGSIVPAFGTMAGGVPVTIHGSGFVPDMEIYFGDQLASDIVYVGPTEYTCVTPPHQVGPVDVTMITP